MTKPLSCDYETKSGVDIKLGLARYSGDPEADVLTFSYRAPDGTLKRWRPGQPNPQDLMDHVARGGLIQAFNALFEYYCWNLICVPKYGWVPLPIEQCVDTMAMAAAMNMPQSLEKLGIALRLPDDKLKNKRGKQLIQKFCKPRKPTKTDQRRWFWDDALFEEFQLYCDDDVVAEEACAKKLRPLTPFEQNIWVLTQRINMRGVPVAVAKIEGIIDVIEAEKARLNVQLRQLTVRRVLKATDRAGMLRWCNERATDIDFELERDEDDAPEWDLVDEDEVAPPLLENMRAKTVDALLERTDLPADVRRALEIRRAVCQTSTAKYPKMLKMVSEDGTLKNMFVYHGAGTGRWAA